MRTCRNSCTRLIGLQTSTTDSSTRLIQIGGLRTSPPLRTTIAAVAQDVTRHNEDALWGMCRPQARAPAREIADTTA